MPISSPSSRSASEFAELIRSASITTQGDCLSAMLRQNERIIDRTLSGVDYLGNPFVPYAGSRRLSAELSVKYQAKRPIQRPTYSRSTSYSFAKSSRIPSALPISRRGPVLGLHSSGYGRAGVKTGTVNLKETGLMHSELSADVDGIILRDPSTAISLYEYPSPAVNASFGVVGQRSEVARYHNEGTPTLPKRRWMDESPSDSLLIERDIVERIVARLNILQA